MFHNGCKHLRPDKTAILINLHIDLSSSLAVVCTDLSTFISFLIVEKLFQ